MLIDCRWRIWGCYFQTEVRSLWFQPQHHGYVRSRSHRRLEEFCCQETRTPIVWGLQKCHDLSMEWRETATAVIKGQYFSLTLIFETLTSIGISLHSATFWIHHEDEDKWPKLRSQKHQLKEVPSRLIPVGRRRPFSFAVYFGFRILCSSKSGSVQQAVLQDSLSQHCSCAHSIYDATLYLILTFIEYMELPLWRLPEQRILGCLCCTMSPVCHWGNNQNEGISCSTQ